AVGHPERLSGLILYGGYARGVACREEPDREREYSAIIDLVRLGWGRDLPAFRQVFTSRFIPDATDEQVGWFNELCRKTSTPAIAAELLAARSRVFVPEMLPLVHVPTLVVHPRQDPLCPIDD